MKLSTYLSCPECDLLLYKNVPIAGEKSHCPRCHYLLHSPSENSVARTFALSLTGLFLLLPANLLPIVGIKVLQNAHEGTLISGVLTLLDEGMSAVAVLVFLSSILFPVLNILLSLLISGHLLFNRYSRYLIVWLKTLQIIEEWAMLEVYLLGIIVACVKLASMAELKLGLGLSAFVLLLLVSITLASNFDNVLFWEKIEQLAQREMSNQQKC